ncbi:hypothetical protein GCM10025868_24280 [Angustibacter aerolatus]|uniref:Uncharacterized protein n=1 Tax=Angustibacter aerolatus TaxID=1162965 RepID=A0ABQ6JG82_9ACTN|nr:hypothetical protein GCM10025868_24280 [Angustibacter aerolatus]
MLSGLFDCVFVGVGRVGRGLVGGTVGPPVVLVLGIGVPVGRVVGEAGVVAVPVEPTTGGVPPV